VKVSSGNGQLRGQFTVCPELAVFRRRDRKSPTRHRRNRKAGRAMATPRFTPQELGQLRELARQWAKIVSKRAFGDDGPGLDVDFRTMEQIATASAQGLTEGTLELLLQQQADKRPAEQPCPTCGKLCHTEPHTRLLSAQGAEVEQTERVAHCPDCRRDFFPLRTALGLDEHGYSSSVIERVVTAAARFSSFRDATDAVAMAGLEISESQVRRLAHEVGAELVAERDRKAVEHRRQHLRPRTDVVPEAVVVEVDGGRIRTRASNSRPGVHEAQNKEDKIVCLATLTGPTFDADPCPEPPESFLCPRRVRRLVNQMKGRAGRDESQEIPEESPTAPAEPIATESTERWSPEKLVRTCVASLESSASFGPLVAAEAQGRHVYAAKRRAFVADGAAYNWSIHAGYFRDFEPVVDLLHVLCYLYSSACAVGADESSGWSQYEVWLRACWQGRVADVLGELDVWQERLGEPPVGEARTAEERRDPRRLVAEARS
jgi:hypothetical protein